MCEYWDVIRIDSKKFRSFSVNGFSYEKPFNFTSDNLGNCSISPGRWNRNDIENLIKGKLKYEINGNLLKITETEKTFETFLRTIGMKNWNEWFFIRIPDEPSQIILNFSFEDDSVMERSWNYPIPFNKEIALEKDCFLWVSGILNGKKINHPLQRFHVDLILNPI